MEYEEMINEDKAKRLELIGLISNVSMAIAELTHAIAFGRSDDGVLNKIKNLRMFYLMLDNELKKMK